MFRATTERAVSVWGRVTAGSAPRVCVDRDLYLLKAPLMFIIVCSDPVRRRDRKEAPLPVKPYFVLRAITLKVQRH